MPTDFSDHDHRGLTPLPDPHGQAALLLVESLIHCLQERAILSNSEAIGIVETALEVQAEVAEVADGASAPMWRAHALLDAIVDSMRKDGDSGTRFARPTP